MVFVGSNEGILDLLMTLKSDVGLCCLLFGNLAYIIYNENQLVGLNIIFFKHGWFCSS